MSDDNSKLSLLMEAGFLAAAMGMTAKAIVIFSALRLVRPDSEAPILGLALTFVNMGRFRDAAQLLAEEGFKKNPDSDLLRAMLGLTFQLAGRENEAAKLFDAVIEADREPTAVKLAANFRPTRQTQPA
jgi:thioredoxin-like negative regulator of GroEL